MPAVDLSRLKKQAAALSEFYTQPEIFLREIHNLLDLYADRTLRPGRIVSPITVLPSYRVPLPVIRQLELDLGALGNPQSDALLTLCDALWKDKHLETRWLAASLLGRLPPQTVGLTTRLTDWTRETREQTVLKALLNTSLVRLRRETPNAFLKLIGEWMSPAQRKLWGSGARALIPLLNDSSFENLPPIFEMVRTFIESAPPLMQDELVDLINTLYRASPTETGLYLRQVIMESQDPQTPISFRRILPSLDERIQELIKPLVKK